MGWWNFKYWACRKYPPSPGRPGRFSRGWPVRPYRGSPTRGWPMDARWVLFCGGRPEFRFTSNVVLLLPREITLANDFDGLPLAQAAHTEPMSGCGTRPMGVRI